jgi:Pvc16 N-terminal domain
VSSYLAIAAVSRTLRRLLWEAFQADPVISAIVGSEMAIVFDNPTDTARDPANRLSLFLYEVTEDEHVKNQPMVRDNGPERTRFAPLALDLGFLVTPFAPSGEANHLLLGKTMQVLYDNATTLLVDPADDVAEELRVVLRRLTLEELTLVWQALREPYRLSVCYEVKVTRLDSLRTATGATVVERQGDLGVPPLEGPE